MSAKRVDRAAEILNDFGQLPEVRWLVARIRQIETPARQACDFATRWPVPGRLGTRLNELRAALADDQFDPPARDPKEWDDHAWRRRATALMVRHDVLLQRARQMADAAGVEPPLTFAEVNPVYADELAAELENLAASAARAYTRKVARS